uniref:Uncharacterized protein n=1 Tax=Anopheles merus TaxID=30066 RepID=A0A182UXI8_ANOME
MLKPSDFIPVPFIRTPASNFVPSSVQSSSSRAPLTLLSVLDRCSGTLASALLSTTPSSDFSRMRCTDRGMSSSLFSAFAPRYADPIGTFRRIVSEITCTSTVGACPSAMDARELAFPSSASPFAVSGNGLAGPAVLLGVLVTAGALDDRVGEDDDDEDDEEAPDEEEELPPIVIAPDVAGRESILIFRPIVCGVSSMPIVSSPCCFTSLICRNRRRIVPQSKPPLVAAMPETIDDEEDDSRLRLPNTTESLERRNAYGK